MLFKKWCFDKEPDGLVAEEKVMLSFNESALKRTKPKRE